MKFLFVLTFVLTLAGCGARKVLVRDCMQCTFGPDHDMCGVASRYCDQPIREKDQCVSRCHSVKKPNWYQDDRAKRLATMKRLIEKKEKENKP